MNERKHHMTPAEINTRINKIAAKFGPKCYVGYGFATGRPDNNPILCSLYPQGVTGKSVMCEYAATFEEALEKIENAAEKFVSTHRDDSIRRLALAMIDKADGSGFVTKDDFKKSSFSMVEVEGLFDDALVTANLLSAKPIFVAE
jgi:hypothetical protein